MATSKKRRKSSRSATGRSQSHAPSAASAQQSAAAAQEEGDSRAEFVEEYSYVRKDLRHLSLISIGLFAVMLVIGFLI